MVIITSPVLALFLGTILSAFPKSTTWITISFPSFVSPPNNSSPNSLHAFLKPVASLTICFFEIFFGIETEIIQNFGIIPFAAKSLMLETTLFLAIIIFESPNLNGISMSLNWTEIFLSSERFSKKSSISISLCMAVLGISFTNSSSWVIFSKMPLLFS